MKKIYGYASLILGMAFTLVLITCAGTVHAAPSPHQFIADTNGDGLGDAVTFDANTGDWWVAPSNGVNRFAIPTRWMHGFGIGSTKQFVENVGGGTSADLITFDANTGDWWVALSNGSNGFQAPSRWMHGHGVGSKNQLLGDVNGDGKKDAVVFFDNGSGFTGSQLISGGWWVATSNLTNNGFDTPGNWFIRGLGVGSSRQFVADIDGDGKADAIVWSNKSGDWWASNSDGVHFATGPNRWAIGIGVGSGDQFVVDMNNDAKADLFIANPSSGLASPPGCNCTVAIHSQYGGPLRVALSNGTNFLGEYEWGSNFGIEVAGFFVNRIAPNDDNDLITFDSKNGDWQVTGVGNQTVDPGHSLWISGFGVGTY